MAQFITPSQNPPTYRDPAEHSMLYENVYFTTSDGVKLHAWFIHQPEPQCHPTIVFFHANAGNMGFRLANLKQLYESLHVNILITSYRGYGESEGSPSEDGLILDAQAAWQYISLRADVNQDAIVCFGRSLGGAVTIALAAEHTDKMRGVVLENTFTSISDLVDTLFPLLRVFKHQILRLRWESIKRIPKVSVPILFISGGMDEVVPKVHMQNLHAAAAAVGAESKKWFFCPEGMHNDTWQKAGPAYTDAIRDFLAEVVPGYPSKALAAVERQKQKTTQPQSEATGTACSPSSPSAESVD